jgi:hypothetical protein
MINFPMRSSATSKCGTMVLHPTTGGVSWQFKPPIDTCPVPFFCNSFPYSGKWGVCCSGHCRDDTSLIDICQNISLTPQLPVSNSLLDPNCSASPYLTSIARRHLYSNTTFFADTPPLGVQSSIRPQLFSVTFIDLNCSASSLLSHASP